MPGIGLGNSLVFKRGGQNWSAWWATRKPSDLIVTGMRDTEIDFEWADNSAGDCSFAIYRSTDGVNYAKIGTTLAGDTDYTATGLTAGNLYYFYVVGVKGGNESDPTNIYDTRFKITVDTTKEGSANDTFVLPTTEAGYDAYVDWGDGGAEQNITGTPGNVSHTYAASGSYQIKIRGTFPRIYFNDAGDKLKLMTIDNWGNIEWSSMQNAFYGCANMQGTYKDAPNLSKVTSIYAMFRSCSAFNQSVANFDTSSVTSMSYMFYGCTAFNQSVANFDTSSVTNMSAMFNGCTAFNQSVANFDTSLVTRMDGMFNGCAAFNQSVSNFDTSSVTNMASMFYKCYAFNQSVSNFDTSKVTDMSYMFYNCIVFNQSVSNFDTSSVENMNRMFCNCTAFNQSVANFDTSLVENMGEMFKGCIAFNQSVSDFDTSSVTNMYAMFQSCTAFNQSVANFDTSSVTNMASMFQSCTAFNQSVANFDTSLVENMSVMFRYCTAFNQSVANFNTSSVTSMSYMFDGCAAFNQSVSDFDTSLVENMHSMFCACIAFKQSLAAFNIEAVTDIGNMCNSCNINAVGTTTNYDATLVSWAAQTVHAALSFNGGTSKYSVAGGGTAARATLTGEPNNWIITDGGQA